MKSRNFSFRCLVACSVLMFNGCAVKDAIDNVIDEIEQTQKTIATQSDAWRAALPKLVDQLNQLEAQASADVKGVIGDTRNQVQGLANDTIRFANINAQEIVAKTGVEFRCNADFTLNGVSARLQYLVDDLKFWKRYKGHSTKQPVHAICQILGENLALYPKSGGLYGIDSTKLVAPNIVEVFGYNFHADALPQLDLVDAAGVTVRRANVTPSYITQYQMAVDFATETFANIAAGSRIVFRWPDQSEPNTINLTITAPPRLMIVNVIFTPPSPIATKDQVVLSATVTNTGSVPSGAFAINWTPQGGGTKSVVQSPLQPTESRTISFAPYVYQQLGPNTNIVALSNGDDVKSFPILVQSNIANVQDFRITKPVVNRAWTRTNIHVVPGNKVEIIEGGGCVNTHGSGDTTKRYIDPMDEHNSCRINTKMYFGTIAIPGTIEEAARKSLREFWLIDRSVIVNRDAFIELGYVDDGLDDNDYKDPDPGTCDQCRGMGPAFVTIRVTNFR